MRSGRSFYRFQYLFRTKMIMLDLDDGLPAKTCWIFNGIDLWRGGAIENSIQPIIVFQPIGGLVFICRERDFTNSGSSLNLYEPDLYCSLWVFRVRPS